MLHVFGDISLYTCTHAECCTVNAGIDRLITQTDFVAIREFVQCGQIQIRFNGRVAHSEVITTRVPASPSTEL